MIARECNKIRIRLSNGYFMVGVFRLGLDSSELALGLALDLAIVGLGCCTTYVHM